MLERIEQRYGVAVTTRPPRIAYRETVASPAEGHYRHKKKTGGAGQSGEVLLRVEPLQRGAGSAFVDAVTVVTIPGQSIHSVEKGRPRALAKPDMPRVGDECERQWRSLWYSWSDKTI